MLRNDCIEMCMNVIIISMVSILEHECFCEIHCSSFVHQCCMDDIRVIIF